VLVSTVFEHEVSVRWRDVDGLGHVNHAVFLTYLEEGRDAFYVQALGRDPHYVVARVEIDMRAEIRYPDRRLQVRIEVERVGTTSLTTRETILTPAGASAAEARVVTVLWDADARKPMAFAADERTRLAAYRSSEPRIRNALSGGPGRLPRARRPSQNLRNALEQLDATIEPREVLGSFVSPPARPAVGGRVAIERSDEVDEEFWHRSVPLSRELIASATA
jgi:acyl-CoA thioester hydrolase